MNRKYVIAIGLAFSVIVVGWLSIKSGGGDSKPSQEKGFQRRGNQAIPVRVATSYLKNHDIYVPALGTIQGNIVAVQPKISGELLKIMFTEGSYVQKGEVLAIIDPRSYQLEMQQAAAKMQANIASLNQAKADLQRSEILYAQQSISKQSLEAQQAQVKQLQAAVSGDQSAVAAAQLKVGDTQVRAPISGYISLRQVEVGNMVSASESGTIATISTEKASEVQFSLPDRLLPQVDANWRAKKGMPLELVDASSGNVIANGMLRSFEQQIQRETATFALRGRVDKMLQPLYSNSFVRVRLRIDYVENAVTVPAEAVIFGRQGYYVWVVNAKKKVERKPVEIGPRVGDVTIIKSGIKAGEMVVTDGVDQLTEGSMVKVAATVTRSEAE